MYHLQPSLEILYCSPSGQESIKSLTTSSQMQGKAFTLIYCQNSLRLRNLYQLIVFHLQHFAHPDGWLG